MTTRTKLTIAIVITCAVCQLALLASAAATSDQTGKTLLDSTETTVTCQYPDRWTNPPGGCDNSDLAVPECIKAMSSQAAEQACIAAQTASPTPADSAPAVADEDSGK